jgi:hypothetical protein
VVFLGTRNPFIAGYLNVLHGQSLLCASRGEPDVIRVGDSVESLFKPVRVTPEGGLTWADPLAAACSLAFQAALYRYATRRAGKPAAACVGCLERGRNDSGAWWVAEPVPKSLDGSAFVAAWRWGVLAPQDRICGIAL